MWLMFAPVEKYGILNGELFGHQFVDNHCLVQKQYFWNFLKYRGFKDITPEGWVHRKPPKMERVLFVHHGGVGDVLFISTVARAYKATFPEIHLTLATNANSAEVFKHNPDVDTLILEQQQSIGHIVDQYDDVVCFDAIIAGNPRASVENVYDEYLRWGGVPSDWKYPRVIVENYEREAMKKVLLEKFNVKPDPEDAIVTIHYESTTPNRNIEPEKFLKLAQKIVKMGFKVFMMGRDPNIRNTISFTCPHCKKTTRGILPSDVTTFKRTCDNPECKKEYSVKNAQPDLTGIFFSYGMGLRDIIVIISLSRYVIGVDSAGIHIGAALGKPTLGVFSSFVGDLRMRYYPRCRWIQAPYRCAPCMSHHIECRWAREKNQDYPPCMTQITTDQIFDEFQKLVKGEPFEREVFVPAAPRKCPVCGSEERTFWWRKGKVCYYECLECTVIYTDLEVEDYHYYNDEDYYICYETPSYIEGGRNLARALHERYAKFFDYTGSFFEVGCARGDVIQELRRLGWKVAGSEISTRYRKRYKEEGLTVYGDVLDPATKIPDKFDIIYMKDSIEHFHSPFKTLRRLAELSGGKGNIISIFTPNTDSWDVKENNKWPHINTYFSGEHTVLYNEKSLKKVAEILGWEILNAEVIADYISMDFRPKAVENGEAKT